MTLFEDEIKSHVVDAGGAVAYLLAGNIEIARELAGSTLH
jgi:hypothetical protein